MNIQFSIFSGVFFDSKLSLGYESNNMFNAILGFRNHSSKSFTIYEINNQLLISIIICYSCFKLKAPIVNKISLNGSVILAVLVACLLVPTEMK